MSSRTILALALAATFLSGGSISASAQEADASSEASSRSGSSDALIRFSFPGGSVEAYSESVKQAMGGVLFGRQPINFLFSGGIESIEIPRMDLVLEKEDFFEIAMKAIVGVPYQVEPDIAGMVTMDFVGGGTVRIGAKYWNGSADLSNGRRAKTALSVAALRASEDWEPASPRREIVVLPVLNLDVVEAAEAISFAMGITEIGEDSEIMAHQPTGTIIFQGAYDAAALARQVLEAAESVKAHRQLEADSEEEASRHAAAEDTQRRVAESEERHLVELDDLRAEMDRLREMYEARIAELEFALDSARSERE